MPQYLQHMFLWKCAAHRDTNLEVLSLPNFIKLTERDNKVFQYVNSPWLLKTYKSAWTLMFAWLNRPVLRCGDTWGMGDLKVVWSRACTGLGMQEPSPSAVQHLGLVNRVLVTQQTPHVGFSVQIFLYIVPICVLILGSNPANLFVQVLLWK